MDIKSITFRRASQQTVDDLQDEIAHLRQLLANAIREKEILKEALASRDEGIEEVEVARLAFLLGNLEIAVAPNANGPAALLWNLFEDGAHTTLAKSLHRAMRGRRAVRRLCPTCEESSCDGCVRDLTRAADERLNRRLDEFNRALK